MDVLVRHLVAVIVVCVVVTGCSPTRPSQPSASQWHEQAAQALEDVASEVAVAQRTLEAQREDKLLGRSGVVLLVEAEEQAGSSVEKFTALQPPKELEDRHADVSEALEQASGLITDARTARVREASDYSALVRSLQRERASLSTLREQVK